MFEIFWKKIYSIFSWFRYRYTHYMRIDNDENEYSNLCDNMSNNTSNNNENECSKLHDNTKLKIKIPKPKFINFED